MCYWLNYRRWSTKMNADKISMVGIGETSHMWATKRSRECWVKRRMVSPEIFPKRRLWFHIWVNPTSLNAFLIAMIPLSEYRNVVMPSMFTNQGIRWCCVIYYYVRSHCSEKRKGSSLSASKSGKSKEDSSVRRKIWLFWRIRIYEILTWSNGESPDFYKKRQQ